MCIYTVACACTIRAYVHTVGTSMRKNEHVVRAHRKISGDLGSLGDVFKVGPPIALNPHPTHVPLP